MTGTNIKALADEMIEAMPAKYQLVYVDYRDQLTDDQVTALIAGDWESFYEDTDEWESESRHASVRFIQDELLDDIIRSWHVGGRDFDEHDLRVQYEGSEEQERVEEEIQNRDESDWVTELARNTPDVLLRINCIDEDHAFSFETVEPAEVLARCELSVGTEDANDENERIVADMLPECSPEFSVLLGYWIVGANVSDLLNLDGDKDVEIENPYLYLGNPFSGSGWIGEKPLVGKVVVKREDLRTDKSAFGYSVDTIYGDLRASSFSAEMRTASDSD